MTSAMVCFVDDNNNNPSPPCMSCFLYKQLCEVLGLQIALVHKNILWFSCANSSWVGKLKMTDTIGGRGEIKLREKKKFKFTDHNKMNINVERINKPVKIKTCSKGTQKVINSLSYIDYSLVPNSNWVLVHLQSYAEHNSKTTTQTY